MNTTYRAVMLSATQGIECLAVEDLALKQPAAGELRVRINAAGVGATDLMMLTGRYSFAPKTPFVPGYEVAGVVDSIGAGVTGFVRGQRVAALTLHGGFSEMLTREAHHFVPIPDAVSDVEAAASILNFVTAWQMIHRVAKVEPGSSALVTGAGGGVGTALLALLRHAGVNTYGVASARKHATLRTLGAIAIDRSDPPFDKQLLRLKASGVDYVFDTIGGTNIVPCLRSLRPGGLLVACGFMGVPGKLAVASMVFQLLIGARLRGRRAAFYGITRQYRKDPGPLLEDLPKIFKLIGQKDIAPVVARTFDLLEAREALALLATGSVQGKLVLTRSAMPAARAPIPPIPPIAPAALVLERLVAR
jgi:NADPH2:quinone reductase